MGAVGPGDDLSVDRGAVEVQHGQHVGPFRLGLCDRGEVAHQDAVPDALLAEVDLVDPGVEPLLAQLGAMVEGPVVVAPGADVQPVGLGFDCRYIVNPGTRLLKGYLLDGLRRGGRRAYGRGRCRRLARVLLRVGERRTKQRVRGGTTGLNGVGLLEPGGHARPLQVVGRLDVVAGGQFDGLLEIGHGLAGLVVRQEHVAQVVVRLGLAARILEGFERLAQATHAGQGQAEVVVGPLGHAAVLERQAEGLHGQGVFLAGDTHHAEVVVNLVHAAALVQFQGLGKVLGGQVVLMCAVVQDAQVVVRLPEHGVEFHGALQMGGGLDVQPGAEIDPARRLVGDGVLGVGREHEDVFGQRLLVQALGDQQVAPLHPGVEVVLVQGDGLVVVHQGHLGIAPAHVAVADLLKLFAGEVHGRILAVGELLEALVLVARAHAAGQQERAGQGHGDDESLLVHRISPWQKILPVHRREHVHGHDDRRAENGHEQGRQDERHKGKKQQHRHARGLFLGTLGTLGPHGVRVDAQGAADADAEGVGLYEQRGQAVQVVQPGPFGQGTQGLHAGLARAQLQGEQLELGADDGAGGRHFVADPVNGLVKAHARFHADDQQVEGVGKLVAQGQPALVDLLGQPVFGAVHAQGGQPHEPEGRGGDGHLGEDEHAQQQEPARQDQGHAALDALEHLVGVRLAQPGADQTDAVLVDLLGLGGTDPGAQPTEHAEQVADGLGQGLGQGLAPLDRGTGHPLLEPGGVARAAQVADQAIPGQQHGHETDAGGDQGNHLFTHVRLLHLDLDDLADDDPPEDHGKGRAVDHGRAQVAGPQQADVVGIDQVQDGREQKRQGDEDVRGHPALGGQDPDLAEQVEPFAHQGGNLGDDLGQVAAGLALDVDGHHEELEVRAVHPVLEVGQGAVHVHAVVDLVQGLAELGADGRIELVGHHAHAAAEGVSGLEGAGHQVQGLGQLLLELVHALALLAPEPPNGQVAQEAAGGGDDPQPAGKAARKAADHAQQGAGQQVHARRTLGLGLVDELFQCADPAHPFQQPVEPRHLAHGVLAQDQVDGPLFHAGHGQGAEPVLDPALRLVRPGLHEGGDAHDEQKDDQHADDGDENDKRHARASFLAWGATWNMSVGKGQPMRSSFSANLGRMPRAVW